MFSAGLAIIMNLDASARCSEKTELGLRDR